jgi:geranylgeranyl diphosphate synthase type II
VGVVTETVVKMELPKLFEGYREQVNSYLNRLLPPEDAAPVPIYRAMRYSVFAGGKRLRPTLVLLVCESLKENPEKLLPVAASVEMIHTYSLIHDDLPSMDNDDFRRGNPTNHRVFGEAIAILAGDALLTAGLKTISEAPYPAEIRCTLLSMLTKAAGTEGMIGGQVLDILSESKVLSRVELEMIHAMKTAALIGYCATAPLVVLQKGETAERAFTQYGESVGLAFQIVDDVLDVEGTTQSLGKTAGKDRTAKKATYPSLIGLEESKMLAADLIQSAKRSIAEYDQLGYLTSFAQFVLERTK